jgi:glycosyltransferase involved in cell wall biosynthesis
MKPDQTTRPKVSVIIPIYNTAPYLRRCLDSVCGQTLRDIEIICVNDGSTDNSLDILNEYAAKDKRIRVLSFSKNRGAGAARNAGINLLLGGGGG